MLVIIVSLKLWNKQSMRLRYETLETPVSGISLGLRPANERHCYIVTTSLIGWAYT